MQAVWVVIGYAGQYEDYDEWLIAAYPDEQEAHKHGDLAWEERNRIACGETYKVKFETPNKYDPRTPIHDVPECKYRVTKIDMFTDILHFTLAES